MVDEVLLEGITGDYQILFGRICGSLGSKGKEHAKNRFGKDKGNLKNKWEGYHLKAYGEFIITAGGHYERNGEQYLLNKERLNLKLKKAGIKNGFEALGQLPSSSASEARAQNFMHGLSLYHSYKQAPLLQTLLDFLVFCRDENDGIMSVFYDGKYDETVKNSQKKLHAEEQARSRLGQTIKEFEPYIDSIFNPPLSHNITNDKDTWLSPANLTQIPFVGREAEIDQLNKFINHHDLFQIWAIEGPSGAGKTRLINEWMNQEKNGQFSDWDFLILKKQDRIDPDSWLTWTPDIPTFVVLDYMFGYEKVVENIILRSANKFEKSVRLLVVDHVFTSPLLSDKRWRFSSGDGITRNRSIFYSTESLNLTKTDDQETILREIIRRRANLDEASEKLDKAIEYLYDTKGAQHPLFAALVGDALRNHQDYNKLQRRELIFYYLQGSKRLPWDLEKSQEDGRWASHFICTATARRSMAYLDMITAANLCEHSPKSFKEVKRICNTVVASNQTTELSPFYPDILGESFFLLFLQELEHSIEFQVEFQQVLLSGDKSTQVKDAIEFVAFIERLVRNLLNDDQSLDDIQEFWGVLFRFLKRSVSKCSGFPKNNPLRWAISVSLVGFIYMARHLFSEGEILELLDQIDEQDVFDCQDAHLLVMSITPALQFLDLSAQLKPAKSLEIPIKARQLFENYKDSQKAEYYLPLLHIAIHYNLIECVQLLIAYDADSVYEKLKEGQTPLISACLLGHSEIVNVLLLKANSTIDFADENGLTALHWACVNGSMEVVTLLLARKPESIELPDKDGLTVLHWACMSGHTEVVTLLLARKPELIELPDKDGRTVLHSACMSGHMEVVTLLLARKPELIDLSDKNGRTVLHWACIEGHTEVVTLLLARKPELIELPDKDGRTVLHGACVNGHTKVARLLLARKLELIELSDKYGLTVLHWACVNGHMEVVTLLLARKPELIYLSDKNGRTVLHWACLDGHTEVVTLLLARKPELIDFSDKDGRTVLHRACIEGHTEVATLLLARKPELIELTDKDGRTALYYAQKRGFLDLIGLLSKSKKR